MAQFKFKTNKMLFKGNQASTCITHCTCTTVIPDPGGGTPSPTCDTSNFCQFFGSKKMPGKIRVVVSGLTFPSYVNCPTTNRSVSFSGSLAAYYDLPQDLSNPCRWLLDIPASTMTATGYSGLNQTGSLTTTSRLRVGLVRTVDGFTLVVSMIFPVYTEFTLFTGIYLGQDFPDNITFPGQTGFAAYCTDWMFGGGRLATGGTGTSAKCPAAVAPTCTCVDASTPACISVSGLVIDYRCTRFVTYTGPVDGLSDRTILPVNKDASCHWTTGTALKAANTTGVLIVVSYNATGSQGCGYYMTISGTVGLAGEYFKAAGVGPIGVYNLYYSYCSGLPSTLTASGTCPAAPQDCSNLGDVWPTGVTFQLTDATGGQHNPVWDAYEPDPGFYSYGPAAITQSGPTLTPNGYMTNAIHTWKFYLDCNSTGWVFTFDDGYGLNIWQAPVNNSGPYLGTYTWVSGYGSNVTVVIS